MLAVQSTTVSLSEDSHTREKEDTYFLVAFIACLIFFVSASLYFFPHIIEGDAVGYVNAMQVFAGGEPTNFADGTRTMTVTIHRMLTTPLSIQALRIFSTLFGSITVGWLVWDSVLFFAVNVLFYWLLIRVFQSHRVAFVGGLFFAGNYALITSGLSFFVDIGGWFFFVLSIFWLFSYVESGRYRDLLIATLAIAVGGLFKENAFVASVPLVAILIYENYPSPVRFLKRSVPLGLIIVAPTMVHQVLIYLQHGYSYLYWIRMNQEVYHYSSRTLEYIKSLGSLLTFLAPISCAGGIALLRSSSASPLDVKRKIFILSVLVSSIPAVLWPGITQRVLFMVVPGSVLLACVFIKKHEHYWWAFLPIVFLYVLASFFMNSFILDFVNLPF